MRGVNQLPPSSLQYSFTNAQATPPAANPVLAQVANSKPLVPLGGAPNAAAASKPEKPQKPSNKLGNMMCLWCTTVVQYPAKATYFRCPVCYIVSSPIQPRLGFVACAGCAAPLSYPLGAMCVECPKCIKAMELPPIPAHMQTVLSMGRKGAQKRKDPKAPKRASNAYMIFCREQRTALKEKRPELPFGKLGARLGEIWREMTAEQKKPYELRAANDRDRYKLEASHYTEGPASKSARTKIDTRVPGSQAQSGRGDGDGSGSGDDDADYFDDDADEDEDDDEDDEGDGDYDVDDGGNDR